MKRFKIKGFLSNASWNWFIYTDRCAICRNDLHEPSIEFQSNSVIYEKHDFLLSKDGKSVGSGKCGHLFHIDCIEFWLIGHKNCPLCSKDWEYQKLIEFF
mmetsp:Transcript_30521/g.61514  ORF Transcript_30521/g.61514 Transcript_30521/m.61514 type:complete len:100 (-) Transcript_30521:65-364(-)